MKIKELIKHEKTFTSMFLFFLWLIFIYLFFLSLVKPIYQDEGVFMAIGKGIWQGSFPYINFWDHKPPGIYYLITVLYSFLKKEIIFYKLFIWLVNIFTSVLVFRISEKFEKGSGKFSVIFFLISLIFFEGNYFLSEPFVALFVTLSSYLILIYPQKKWTYLGSGFLLAIAILFKQTAAIFLIPLFLYILFRKNLKKALMFLVGLFIPITILIGYLSENNALLAFWHQTIIATLMQYPREPLIKVLNSWTETFLRTWWIIVGIILFLIRKTGFSKDELLLILLACLPITSFFVRSYPHYWIQVLPFLATISGLGFSRLKEFVNKSGKKYILIALYLVILFSLFKNAIWFRWITLNLNKPRQIEQMQALKTVESLNPTYILAENYYTSLYFLCDEKILTKYLYLTEVNETDDAREKTFEALISNHDIVILWPHNQNYVYAKEIGKWLERNTKIITSYPALNLDIYYKN